MNREYSRIIFIVFLFIFAHSVNAYGIYDGGAWVGYSGAIYPSVNLGCSISTTCPAECNDGAALPSGQSSPYAYNGYTCAKFYGNTASVHMDQPDDEAYMQVNGNIVCQSWNCSCDCLSFSGAGCAGSGSQACTVFGIDLSAGRAIGLKAHNDCYAPTGSGSGSAYVENSEETCCIAGYHPSGMGKCEKDKSTKPCPGDYNSGEAKSCGSGVCRGTQTCQDDGKFSDCSSKGNQCLAPADCKNASLCDSTGSCPAQTNKPDGAACDDKNICTSDGCNNGICIGIVNHGTHKECSGASCVPVANSASSCKDTCTSNASCSGCTSNNDCNDNNSCTTDTCNTATGICSHNAVSGAHKECSESICASTANTSLVCADTCANDLSCGGGGGGGGGNVCVPNYNQACASSPNSCGMTNSGTVLCNGACSATVPSDAGCVGGGGDFAIQPTSLIFNAKVGGPNPDIQYFYIINGLGYALFWTGTPSASWISVSPSAGTLGAGSDAVKVNVNISGKAAGTYTGSVIITNTQFGQTKTLTITLNLSPPLINGSCSSATNICNAGAFSDTADGACTNNWNCVGQNGGSTASCSSAKPPVNGTLSGWNPPTCPVSCGGGTQTRTCTGASCGGDATCGGQALSQSCNTQSCLVPKSTISLNPNTLSFSGVSGGATPAGKTLIISNTGTATLNWGGSTNQDWCHIGTTSGSVSAGGSQNVTVNVDAPSNVGTFNCVITISDPNASNNPQTISVTYTVAASAPSTYNLNLNKTGGGSGTIGSNPSGASFPAGAIVSLIATPDSGSVFSGWSGDPDCGDGLLTMNANKNCIANFSVYVPPADFQLNISGAIHATLIPGGPAKNSSEATTTITAFNGFNDNVALSVESASPNLTGATYHFSDTSLASSKYSKGSAFYVTVPSATPAGLYVITIKGRDGGLIRTATVNLNVESYNPDWREI